MGPRIWIKRDDLTGSLLSGNKVRKLNFLVARALAEGCDTLITCGGVQSNHCRATALVGAQLGLKVCLILRDDGDVDVKGNLLLDHLAGARVEIYSRREYTAKLAQLFEHWQQHYRQQGAKPFCIPTGASNDTGVWGYVDCSRELMADFKREKIEPKHVYTATGSGGTQAGLTLGLALHDCKAQVLGVAVCDSEDYFLNKVRRDLAAWQSRYAIDVDLDSLSVKVNANYIGPGYAHAGPEVFQTITWLAQQEGIVLDPVYTGKAFHALISEIKNGRHRDESDIVFVHTGGLFGLFAQQQHVISNM